MSDIFARSSLQIMALFPNKRKYNHGSMGWQRGFDTAGKDYPSRREGGTGDELPDFFILMT